MTSFVQPRFPTTHAGVDRAEQAVASVQAVVQSPRAGASLLLAAIVSAVVVVANQIIDTWTEGHLLAAWVLLWAVGFAALALLATPARRAARVLGNGLQAGAAARRQAASDARFLEAARSDARMMAELSAAMSRQGRELARFY